VWCSRCMGDELPHQIATPAEECKQLELLRTNVAKRVPKLKASSAT
jgi:hypothetical protein